VIELVVLVLGEDRLHATAKSMWSSTKCSPSRGGGEVRLGVIYLSEIPEDVQVSQKIQKKKIKLQSKKKKLSGKDNPVGI